jgi:hypothetical protein
MMAAKRTRTHNLMVRLNKDERRMVEQLARKLRLPMAAALRQAISSEHARVCSRGGRRAS